MNTDSEQDKNKQYQFTQDWHSAVADNWQRLLIDFKGRSELRYLEVGIFEGRSMIWMFENILTAPDAKATAVDVFWDAPLELVESNLEKAGILNKVKLIKGNSQVQLRSLLPHSFDLIYVDGDHRGRGVLMDLTLCWELLCVGGVLIFDDYVLHSQVNPVEAQVKAAADMFVTCFQNEMEIVAQDNRQIFMKKVELYREDYITQAGPLYFSWGVEPSQRRLMNGQTGQEILLSDLEKKYLAEALLRRPLGVIKASWSQIPEEYLESLKAKASAFFSDWA